MPPKRLPPVYMPSDRPAGKTKPGRPRRLRCFRPAAETQAELDRERLRNERRRKRAKPKPKPKPETEPCP